MASKNYIDFYKTCIIAIFTEVYIYSRKYVYTDSREYIFLK